MAMCPHLSSVRTIVIPDAVVIPVQEPPVAELKFETFSDVILGDDEPTAGGQTEVVYIVIDCNEGSPEIDGVETPCQHWDEKLEMCSLEASKAIVSKGFDEAGGDDHEFIPNTSLMRYLTRILGRSDEYGKGEGDNIDERPVVKYKKEPNEKTPEGGIQYGYSTSSFIRYLKYIIGDNQAIHSDDLSIYDGGISGSYFLKASLIEHLYTLFGRMPDMINYTGSDAHTYNDPKTLESRYGASFLKYLSKIAIGEEDDSRAPMLRMFEHTHDMHLHLAEHSADEGYVIDPEFYGEDAGATHSPQASILVMEFCGNEDLDDDGFIYGFDFKIKDDEGGENKKPIMLKNLEIQPDWDETRFDETNSLDWEEWLVYKTASLSI